MKRGKLVSTVAISLLVIASLAGYRYFVADGSTVSLPVVEGCALHLEPCSTSFPRGGRMTLEINPRSPSSTDPLHLNASFEGVEPTVVGVRFKGVDMNMGYLEHYVFDLQRKDAAETAVSFSGDAGVFACSRSLMQWLVLVRVQLGPTRYEVPFKLETRQQG